MNHNLVIDVIYIYKQWLFGQLRIEREYLNDATIQHEQLFEFQKEVETRIYLEEDEEARDDLRLELRNYENKIWRSAANLNELEQAYNWLKEIIDEEKERLDEIVGDGNITDEEWRGN